MSDSSDAPGAHRAAASPSPGRSDERSHSLWHALGRLRLQSGRRRGQPQPLPWWQETLLLLVLALILATGIKSFFLQAFYIPSGSMEETLRVDDRILVEKPSYWFGEPDRGDIVVFSDPGGWLRPDEARKPSSLPSRLLEFIGLYPTGGHLVKRVIGVGGDHVRCCDKQDRMRVNGFPLDEDYLPEGVKPSLVRFDQVVPEGHLWVQGDNRPGSADSRLHLGDPGGGMVPVGDVVGRVFTVIWPWRDASWLDRPETFDDVPAAEEAVAGGIR